MATLASYKYLGLNTVVEADYEEPDVKLDLWGGVAGTYDGLDAFGRVIDHRWIDYGPDPDVDAARIQYGYDRNSNRLWRQNDVARAASKQFDQQYTYDGLNRLDDFKRGELDTNKTIPGADLTFRQQFGLGPVGNWKTFDQDDNGNGTWDLEQSRTNNKVNEITDITETTGSSWATPTYDANGNTTAFPKPSGLTANYTATYDAWNRLVKIEDGANTVQENVYDGRNFRVVRKDYSGGTLDETRHIYFNSDWQAVEERVDSETDAERIFIWGLGYIDDLILRDRDTDGNGTLDERLYVLNDANWNVTTLVNTTGDVQQRFEYDAYGKPIVLTSAWASTTDSYEWETLFAGYRFDPTLLYLVRNRVLHAELGRWVQRDPLGYADGLNLNEFVRSDAANHNDPFGLKTIQVLIVSDFNDNAFGPISLKLRQEIEIQLNELFTELVDPCCKKEKLADIPMVAAFPGIGNAQRVQIRSHSWSVSYLDAMHLNQFQPGEGTNLFNHVVTHRGIHEIDAVDRRIGDEFIGFSATDKTGSGPLGAAAQASNWSAIIYKEGVQGYRDKFTRGAGGIQPSRLIAVFLAHELFYHGIGCDPGINGHDHDNGFIDAANPDFRQNAKWSKEASDCACNVLGLD